MNNTNNTSLINLIDFEDELLVIFIISLIVSLLLNYNYKLRIKNKPPIWNNQTAKNIAIINSIVVVCATIGQLYIVLEEKETIDIDSSLKRIEIYGLELFIGIVAVIISIAELYIVMNLDEDDIIPYNSIY